MENFVSSKRCTYVEDVWNERVKHVAYLLSFPAVLSFLSKYEMHFSLHLNLESHVLEEAFPWQINWTYYKKA